MKKTLLIAAAALAAGMISVQAQNVYSQNIVGYYNTVVPAHGYAFVANQLLNGSDSAKTNNDLNVALSSGLISDPAGINNTVLYYWSGGNFSSIFQYFNTADAASYWGGSSAGWYDGNGNISTVPFNPGSGHFLYNASSVPLTNTIVGTVNQLTNVIPVITGFNTYSIIAPVSTNIDSVLGTFPGTSDANGVNNDVYYGWDGSNYSIILQYFNTADASSYWGGSSSGWYDGNGNNASQDPTKFPKVGQAFFIHHFGAPVNWTNSFTIQ